MKTLRFFWAVIAGLFLYFSAASLAHAAELHLSTDRVTLDASDFSITTAGKTFVGNNISVHSDTGTPSNTTLEATWQEQGVEMRLFMYFGVDNGQWKVTDIRTYNGAQSGDWLYYNGFTGGALGSTYTTGSFDEGSTSGAGTGTLHFSNLSLKPNFVTQDYAITVTSPNGGESFTPGSNLPITWNFANPGRTDTSQTFNTSIYLVQPDGTKVLTIVGNQSITKFNGNTYNWTVPTMPGNFKILVYMDTPFSTANGTQNLNDISDNTFTIVGQTQQTSNPTATPTPGNSSNNSSSSNQSSNVTKSTLGITAYPSPTGAKNDNTKDDEKGKSKDTSKNQNKNHSGDKKIDQKSKNIFSNFFSWVHSLFTFFHK